MRRLLALAQLALAALVGLVAAHVVLTTALNLATLP